MACAVLPRRPGPDHDHVEVVGPLLRARDLGHESPGRLPAAVSHVRRRRILGRIGTRGRWGLALLVLLTARGGGGLELGDELCLGWDGLALVLGHRLCESSL